jgi:hypothetical protein
MTSSLRITGGRLIAWITKLKASAAKSNCRCFALLSMTVLWGWLLSVGTDAKSNCRCFAALSMKVLWGGRRRSDGGAEQAGKVNWRRGCRKIVE